MTKNPTKSCLAVRHVAFEDIGLLGPLLADRGYDVQRPALGEHGTVGI